MIGWLSQYLFLVIMLSILLGLAGLLTIIFATSFHSLFTLSKKTSWVIGVLTALLILAGFYMYITVPYSESAFLRSIPPSPPYWIYRFPSSTQLFTFLITSLLTAGYYFINRKIISKKILWTITITFFVFFGLFLFAYFDVLNPCKYQTVSNFHYFNAHLKSLCIQRADISECPKDEGALAAFNPRRWSELNQCAQATYTFDEVSQDFLFKVSNSYVTIKSDRQSNQEFTYESGLAE